MNTFVAPQSTEQAIEKLAERYVKNLVWANQTNLISAILEINFEGEHEGLPSMEDAINFRLDASDWDQDRLRHYVEGEIQTDWDDFLTDLRIYPANEDEIAEGNDNGAPVWDLWGDDLDVVREAINEWTRDNNLEYAEVFEWYLVDSWLAARLKEEGEVVLSDGSSHWWGRTCTGQAILMDGIFHLIAAGQLIAHPYLREEFA